MNRVIGVYSMKITLVSQLKLVWLRLSDSVGGKTLVLAIALFLLLLSLSKVLIIDVTV